ncbi:MAG: phosphonate C-P lyase system protein PhnH [Pseudomonadota bacterium]
MPVETDARTDALTGGFANPPQEAAYAFRAALDAMARPGRITTLDIARPPAPLSAAAGTLLLTLADPGTPVHLAGALDTPEIRQWIAFHTGAPLAPRTEAAFAVGAWDALLPLEDYPLGSQEYPDRSATLIVEREALSATGARLTGPGIETAASLDLPAVDPFQANRKHFPRGLDFFFTCKDRVAALPRTTLVQSELAQSEEHA